MSRTPWRYVFADLLTDRDIADVELAGVTFDRRIIVPGTFRATLPVPNADVAAKARRILAGRTVAHVYRGADIWGTYLIWTAVPRSDRGAVTVELTGATLESWLWHRVIAENLRFTGADQVAIARRLIDGAQTAAPPYQGAVDIGLIVAPGASGVVRDRTYRAAELASVGQRLDELANVDNGFEWMVRTYLHPGTGRRVRLWDWGYPALGQATAPWQFTEPGNVVGWQYPASAADTGTAHWARGDSVETDLTADAEPLFVGPVVAAGHLAAGWPWLDAVSDHSGVTNTSTLDQYAMYARATRSGATGIPIVTVHLPEAGGITPNNLGDAARLTLVNPYYPLAGRRPSFDARWRVVGVEVTPAGRDDGGDLARLVFAEDT